MLSARRIGAACPQCRARLLNLYESGFAGTQNRISGNRTRAFARTALLPDTQTRAQFRTFSSTYASRQDTQVNRVSNGSDDAEKIVRQAREIFGDTLPKNYLNEHEYKIYLRLYGPPLRETKPEDVGMPFPAENGDAIDGDTQNLLLRETGQGFLEQVEYELEQSRTVRDIEATQEALEALEAQDALEPPQEHPAYINVVAKNQREYDALTRLQKDFEAAAKLKAEQDAAKAQEEQDEDEGWEEEQEENKEEEEEDEGEPDVLFTPTARLHPFTVAGQFRTSPSTLYLPREGFVDTISTLLTRTDITHVKDAAERAFGGPGLPFSPATPENQKHRPQHPIGMQATHHKSSDINADAFIATMLPGIYASVMSSLVEVRKRLGPDWLRSMLLRSGSEGPRVLDVGAGGAGLVAWEEVLQAEWDMLRDEGKVASIYPPGKRTVVIGSDNLRHRISHILPNTQFLPRLPDYAHSADNVSRLLDAPITPQQKKTYDVIIAPHNLMPLDKEHQRRAFINNLWSMLSPEGGVLIVLEKGIPRGFEAVAEVRSRMLNEFLINPTASPEAAAASINPAFERVREPGMIVAPCTNHAKCPMYPTSGINSGRKDYCHFSQRFIRPPFLQRIIGVTHRNHENIKYSFVAVRRGVSDPRAAEQGAEATDRAFAGFGDVDTDAAAEPNLLAMPRNILPPLKRKGHVTLDLCTPAGAIERWTVPRSFSRQAYHDARKTKWGDLWALGAKTRVRRDVRLGRGAADGPNDGGVRAREAARGKKPRVIEITAGPDGVGAMERFGRKGEPVQRRTKGGKKAKFRDILKELREDEEEEARHI